MASIFPDTAFGRLVNLLSRGKYFQPDDTVYLANLKEAKVDAPASDSERSDPENIPATKEEVKTPAPVQWIENDPQNPRNWSLPKKVFVTFQICFLTTAVYMGSAIYTAGLVDIEKDFNKSTTSALLGLTLFVLGYALGPMVWVSYIPAMCCTRSFTNLRL